MYIAHREEIKDELGDITVYISVTESKASLVESFINDIKLEGFKVHVFVKNSSNFENLHLVNHANEMLLKADVGIIVLDDLCLTDQKMNEFTMYEAGILISKKLYLFNADLSKEAIDLFSKSPIRDVQLSNQKSIISALGKYITLPRNLFNDKEVDLYAKDRIFYIKFLVMMDIRYASVKKIFKRLSRINDDITEEGQALSMLEDSMTTGVTVIFFGRKDHLTNDSIWPYKAEMKILERDFPVRSVLNKVKVFKKSFEEENEDQDVVATMKLEFVVPNHEILGVSFQAFFQLEETEILPNDIINILVADGIPRDNITVHEHGEMTRVYYPLYVDNNRRVIEAIDEMKEKYGPMSNYFYPK